MTPYSRKHSTAATLSRKFSSLLASIATGTVELNVEAKEVVINHLIRDVASAISVLSLPEVCNARSQTLAHPNALHPRSHGARVFGLSRHRRVSTEWAAYANTIAVELQRYSDAATISDSLQRWSAIPALLAITQHCNRSGEDLARGIVAACEISHKLEKMLGNPSIQISNALIFGPAIVGGIGAVLKLEHATVQQAIENIFVLLPNVKTVENANVGLKTPFFAGHTAKLAIETVDRCMRDEIYHGIDENTLLEFFKKSSLLDAIEFFESTVGDTRYSFGINEMNLSRAVEDFSQMVSIAVSKTEQQQFLTAAQRLFELPAGGTIALNITADAIDIGFTETDGRGIF